MDAGGLPMLNCLLQHTLKSLCTSSSSTSSDSSSKWVYSIFWRILPRNYPPPKWDHGGSLLDRTKGNKRNWILVWEDGYYDFYECERAESEYVKGRFGADIFFKMSHEVYNFGEGLVGKVASDNSHKWVFRDSTNETDPNFTPSWNVSIDPQPRAWESHFNSGIQTIAIISVREGVIQLGSFYKIVEDLNLVINIQRKFSYLQSIPGIYAVQRPYLPLSSSSYPHASKSNTLNITIETSNETTDYGIEEKRQLIGSKRHYFNRTDDFPMKSINLGYNSPENGIPVPGPSSETLWSIPPLLPFTPYHHSEDIFSKMLPPPPPYQSVENEVQRGDIKVETSCGLEADQQEECRGGSVELGFGQEQTKSVI
ncbi:hypothetical protein M9H77_32443 [Catharanthus roseus]|uniref:Uncharacterized protein n=1 Tax=Catharanthus roseus TaxID=4058 RepID=A0ACC0A3B9_CATRO|nr:hypothetical protein M9H77_32443 [Catharanthus roseus]